MIYDLDIKKAPRQPLRWLKTLRRNLLETSDIKNSSLAVKYLFSSWREASQEAFLCIFRKVSASLFIPKLSVISSLIMSQSSLLDGGSQGKSFQSGFTTTEQLLRCISASSFFPSGSGKFANWNLSFCFENVIASLQVFLKCETCKQ